MTPDLNPTAAYEDDAPAPVRLDAAALPTGGDRYELLGEIARGGMGVVHRGRDPALGRDLAVKVLTAELVGRPGSEQRFVEEAQVGGQLQHPGVVPVYELGRFGDGRPYFTMKLVKGRTLADLLAARETPAHDRPRFLKVFEQICQTVAYAHSKGVLHRDLKPANVMVGSFGEVQVMDWGLAKVLRRPEPPPSAEALAVSDIRTLRFGSDGSDTQAGSVLGTPAYMPPEQAGGESDKLDERADVFGLGAILCAILTGEPPYRGGPESVRLQAVRGQLQDAFARLAGCGADGELIALGQRCLAAEPTERPRHAGAVATAVTAHLAGVEERAQRAELERAKADARRRLWAKAGSAVAAVLLLGVAGTAYGLWRADQSRRATEMARAMAAEQARVAEAVSAFFLNDVIRQADSRNQSGATADPDLTVREALRRAAASLDGRFVGQELTEAAVRLAVGESQRGVGDAVRAVPHLKRAWELRQAALGPDAPATLDARAALAFGYRAAGRLADALPVYEDVLARRRAALGADHSATLQSLNNLALAYHDAGRGSDALPLFQESLRLTEACAGPDHPNALTVRSNVALALEDVGDFAAAVTWNEETLRRRQAALGPDHPDTLISLNNLAAALRAVGRAAEALPLFVRAVERRRVVLGQDHPETLASLNNLALARQESGSQGEAVPIFEEIVRRKLARLGPDHPDTLTSQANLALGYLDLGQPKKALALHADTRERRQRVLGADHPETWQSQSYLAAAHRAAGHFDEAARLFAEVLPARRRLLGPDHPATLGSMTALAATYWSLDRLDLSIPLFEESVQRLRAKLGAHHPETLLALANLGTNLSSAGRHAEALPPLETAYRHVQSPRVRDFARDSLLSIYPLAGRADAGRALALELVQDARRQHPADSLELAAALARWGAYLAEHDAPADAEPLFRECWAVRKQRQPEAWNTFNAQALLGSTLLGQKNYADAEPLLRAGYAGMKQRERDIPAEGRANLTNAARRLAELYAATGKPELAAEWRSKAAARP